MTAELTCFGESGNAYKAALTLELSGYDWQPVFVDFFRGEARTDDYRALNEMAEVPVFQEDGLRLSQSCVIQLHVAERTGRFLDGDRNEILRWMFWDAHRGSGMQGTARFIGNFLPEDKRPEGVPRWLTGRVRAALKILDARLEGRDWIVGDAPTLADLACCGYLYYDEPFGYDAAAFPAVARWLDRIAALPGWKHPYDLMPPALPRDAG